MSTLYNNYDALEKLIFEEGLRIQAIDVHKDLDILIIVLNSQAILKQKLSSYQKLKNATKEELLNYQFIGDGTGIHWPVLDEDLSLKGFLQNELRAITKKDLAA